MLGHSSPVQLAKLCHIKGFPKTRGTSYRGPSEKDCSILGSMLGSPHFGKLTFQALNIPQTHRGTILHPVLKLQLSELVNRLVAQIRPKYARTRS